MYTLEITIQGIKSKTVTVGFMQSDELESILAFIANFERNMDLAHEGKRYIYTITV